jgi:hypothetical protein
MTQPRRIQRTRTDRQRIEHLAEVDGNRDRVVELEVGVRPWLAGSIVSAVQVQVLGDPADPELWPIQTGPRKP